MEDIIATLIIVTAVYFAIRWLIGGKSSGTAEGGIRGVTPAMVETVHSAFPDIPVPNIIYHLSRTKSAQSTSEEILERGFLAAPPPTFNMPASLLPTTTPPAQVSNTAQPQNTKTASAIKAQSLIDRYNLSSRVPSLKGKEKAVEENQLAETSANAASKWEDSKEKREMGLKERKEKMILEARRRMLEKQAKEKEGVAV
ncbi:hypothetical protein L198_01506 [Cryptococcus wingfieldii CBS 7118]|uniref:CUE domain-containing protein n=1 Tax=Cryptococcus wingfieldii CBS 7118 TaxID=1295528 RepID=A0A1E3JZH2_9TREE|nr:hypothetical protein L198_01506 [Cryptococcus wingfieldii CBS 7118]ODO06274.1 hypothetical protein L198_01506 [Cryptococcus wingfieldii CBS 7118]